MEVHVLTRVRCGSNWAPKLPLRLVQIFPWNLDLLPRVIAKLNYDKARAFVIDEKGCLQCVGAVGREHFQGDSPSLAMLPFVDVAEAGRSCEGLPGGGRG